MQANQIVIVDHTKSIDPALLHNAAAAIDIQVTQQLAKTWDGINASVSASQSLSAIQGDAWPVFLVKSLPPGEGGYHQDKNNQPYAKIIASAEDPSWTIDASHEICEMLVDPYGSRMNSSQAIRIEGDGVVDAPGTFKYLVEACDPCESNRFAYEIQGIAVSDFITPNYYDPTSTPGTLYSFRGNITRPRELLKGGYISFIDAGGAWQQILWVNPGAPVLTPLSEMNTASNAGVVQSPRMAVHIAMGKAATIAKHEQRRRKGGLPEAVQARVDEFATQRRSPRHDEDLKRRYGILGNH
jgi:hypothetical protein